MRYPAAWHGVAVWSNPLVRCGSFAIRRPPDRHRPCATAQMEEACAAYSAVYEQRLSVGAPTDYSRAMTIALGLPVVSSMTKYDGEVYVYPFPLIP